MVEKIRNLGRRQTAILVAAASTAAGLSQLLTPGGASAANVTWGNTGITWNAGANWVGGTPPANSATADGAIFQGAPVAQPFMSASASIGSLDFQSGGWSFSGSTLTLGTGGASGQQGINSTTNATGTITINNANLVLSASQIWTQSVNVDVTGNTLFNGTSTSRSLTLNGTGDVNIIGPMDLNSASGAPTAHHHRDGHRDDEHQRPDQEHGQRGDISRGHVRNGSIDEHRQHLLRRHGYQRRGAADCRRRLPRCRSRFAFPCQHQCFGQLDAADRKRNRRGHNRRQSRHFHQRQRIHVCATSRWIQATTRSIFPAH